MDYIYDIVLNFQEKYYDFYEWKISDKLINIKRIPIYKIKTKDYLNIKNNDVSIDRTTLPKSNRLFLLTNGREVMGIIISNKGKVLKRSSLIFEENDEILEDRDEIKLINIKYRINNTSKIDYRSRVETEKYNYVIDYLNKTKDIYIFKYLYYLIYEIDESNIIKIKKELNTLLNNNLNKIYDSIEKLNIELKKLPNNRKF